MTRRGLYNMRTFRTCIYPRSVALQDLCSIHTFMTCINPRWVELQGLILYAHFLVPTQRCLAGYSSEETCFAFEINYGDKVLSAPGIGVTRRGSCLSPRSVELQDL